MNITKDYPSLDSITCKDIYDFTRKAVDDTKLVYGPNIPIENRHQFYLHFCDYLTTSILAGIVNSSDEYGNYIAYASHDSFPTLALRYALAASGIAKDGLLPQDSCYTTERLLLSDEVRNQAFEYKTEAKDLVAKIDQIYQWLMFDQNNLNADPNASELVEIFINANNIVKSGGNLPAETKTQLTQIWENRKNNFVKNNLGSDSFAYEICDSCFDGQLSQNYIDLASLKLLQIMAGVDLWINQEKRAGNEVRFNNRMEMEQISNCYLASKQIGSHMDTYMNRFVKLTNISINDPVAEGRHI